MRAVHLESGKISIRRQAIPNRPVGFSLIKTVVAGICNTDLELLRGYYSFSGTPGHEFVGIVQESDNPSLIGQRVVGEINIACEDCEFCASRLGRHCPNRTVLGIVRHPGAFAEYVTLPDRNVHILSPELKDEEAVFTEPLAAACEVLDQVEIAPGTPVAVLGDGKLGLLISFVLQIHGAQVILFGRHERKLSIARAFGVQTSIVQSIPTARFKVAVEATGTPAGLSAAIGLVRPRGTIVLKSTIHDPVVIDTAPVIVNEISLIGSRCGRFEPALDLLRSRRINVSQLIDAEFPLEEASDAYAAAGRKGTLKVLLRC